MNTDETQDYLEWKRGFSWGDDGLHAFRAIKALEKIRFEIATREEGYVGRIKEIASS